jgi:protein MAK11
MMPLHAVHHPLHTHDTMFCKLSGKSREIFLTRTENKKVSIYDIPEDPEWTPKIVVVMIGYANR